MQWDHRFRLCDIVLISKYISALNNISFVMVRGLLGSMAAPIIICV